MSKKKTTEEFIQRGKELFGNRFDYSESVYVNAHTKIKIICRKHGLLTNLTPNKHLRRNGGCKECKSEKSRRELSNEYLVAKFGLDSGENEPSEVCEA